VRPGSYQKSTVNQSFPTRQNGRCGWMICGHWLQVVSAQWKEDLTALLVSSAMQVCLSKDTSVSIWNGKYLSFEYFSVNGCGMVYLDSIRDHIRNRFLFCFMSSYARFTRPLGGKQKWVQKFLTQHPLNDVREARQRFRIPLEEFNRNYEHLPKN
jgi:hypothetical protein